MRRTGSDPPTGCRWRIAWCAVPCSTGSRMPSDSGVKPWRGPALMADPPRHHTRITLSAPNVGEVAPAGGCFSGSSISAAVGPTPAATASSAPRSNP